MQTSVIAKNALESKSGDISSKKDFLQSIICDLSNESNRFLDIR